MVVSIIAWSAASLGALLAVRGFLRALPAQSIFGVGFAAYALALLPYAQLGLFGGGRALSTLERTWGATASTVGGWAVLSLLLAIHWSHRTGRPSWTDPAMFKRLAALSVAAIVSIVTLHLTLEWPGQAPLPPSTDFLNDYGDRRNVVVYQLLFATWLGVPVGMLGVTTWKFRSGVARWVTSIGCGFGVFWAVWKICGILVRFLTGDRIAIESPVSVTTGVITLVLVLAGLLIGMINGSIASIVAQRGYSAARRADDERQYDSDASSAA